MSNSNLAVAPNQESPNDRQLAVVQGLVMDRIQTISRGNEIFTERCCRMSYGIIGMEEYNPNLPRHIGQPTWKDARDGKTWVENQIQWFVKQVIKPKSFAGVGRTENCAGTKCFQ